MQVHNAILANRAHQLRLGSKFKAAGNTVKNAKRLVFARIIYFVLHNQHRNQVKPVQLTKI